MDVLTTFGDLEEELAANCKYAKWKAAYIHNCLKNGEMPVPGPLAEDGGEGADSFGEQSKMDYHLPSEILIQFRLIDWWLYCPVKLSSVQFYHSVPLRFGYSRFLFVQLEAKTANAPVSCSSCWNTFRCLRWHGHVRSQYLCAASCTTAAFESAEQFLCALPPSPIHRYHSNGWAKWDVHSVRTASSEHPNKHSIQRWVTDISRVHNMYIIYIILFT